jgi:hypothetical protein
MLSNASEIAARADASLAPSTNMLHLEKKMSLWLKTKIYVHKSFIINSISCANLAHSFSNSCKEIY